MIKRFSRRRENQPDNHATFSLSFFFATSSRRERERKSFTLWKIRKVTESIVSLYHLVRGDTTYKKKRKKKRKEKRNGRNAKGVHYFGRGDGETLEEIIERDVEFRDVAVDRAARPRYISR